MNSTSSSLFLEDSFQLAVIYYVFTIGYQYIFTISCGIGIVINLICLIVLMSPSLSGDMYKYLLMKTIAEMVTLFSSFSNIFSTCRTCPFFQSYASALISIIIVSFSNSTSYTCSAFCEIILSYDRLKLFKRNSKLMPTLNFKFTCIGIVSISILVNIPILFSKNVISIRGAENKYIDMQNEFGTSTLYSCYTLLLNVLQTILPLLILITLNTIVTFEFRRYLNRKRTMKFHVTNLTFNKRNSSSTAKSTIVLSELHKSKTRNEKLPSTIATSINNTHPTIEEAARISRKNEENNLKFTSMILVSSSLFALSRLIECIPFVWLYINQLKGVKFDGIRAIFTYFAFQLTFIHFSTNIFIYVFFNRNFKKAFFKLFKN
jgi:hypothetical protein